MKNNLEKVFDFLHEVENLKSTLRYCTTKSGRKESTAEHSWRLALFSFIIAEELNLDIDRLHSMKIAIVHDIAEALTGDIDAILIAEGKVSREEKQKKEIGAINKLKDILPEKIGNEIYTLWKEYDEGFTREAKFIKAIENMETTTYLTEVGYKHYDVPEAIATYPDKAVNNFPELKPILKIIKAKLKKEFEKGNIPWKEEYDRS